MTCRWKSSNDENIKCERKADKSGYCIFHKSNKNKEENQLIKKYIIEENITDFSGFVFEDEFNISKILTDHEKELNFFETIFKKDANFKGYEFKKDVKFKYTDFRENVNFENSKFQSNVTFYKTKFNSKYISKKIFERVKFKGQNLIIKNVENLPRMDGIQLDSCTKLILINVDYKKEEYLYGKINYRIARNQARTIGDHERVGYYYYKERCYGGKIINKDDYPSNRDYLSAKFFDGLSRYTIGYGEKPLNILYISISIISIFAFLYLLTGVKVLDYSQIGISIKDIDINSLKELVSVYIDAWYFSMVTFTTVGYGDMVVTSIIGKILVSIEVFFGVTMGATWASVIINRMIK